LFPSLQVGVHLPPLEQDVRPPDGAWQASPRGPQQLVLVPEQLDELKPEAPLHFWKPVQAGLQGGGWIPSSTEPLQSLSLPSQTSAVMVDEGTQTFRLRHSDNPDGQLPLQGLSSEMH